MAGKDSTKKDVADILAERMAQPQSVTIDGQTVTQTSAADLLKLLKARQGMMAARSGGTGMRMGKMAAGRAD